MMHKLRSSTLHHNIIILMLLVVAACIVIGINAYGLYSQGLRSQASQAQEAVEQACDEIQSLYLTSASGKEEGFRLDLANVVLELLLSRAPGIEGGVWGDKQGFVAYAFPSYEGGPKKDTPPAEQAHIAKITREVLTGNHSVSDQRAGERDLRILAACALTSHYVAWAMTRIDVQATRAAEHSAFTLGALAVVILAVGAWHTIVLRRWSRALESIAVSVARSAPESGQVITATGYPDLDRIVNAFNTFNVRIKSALERSSGLERDLRQAERSAFIGRMVAGLAHEIRNPLGAMRLKAESALAGEAERREPALVKILAQIGRLEGLLTRLLSLVRSIKPEIQEVDIDRWLKETLCLHVEQARNADVELIGQSSVNHGRFDPVLMAEALDNLIQNALQHTPAGGTVQVMALRDARSLIIQVADTGPGIQSELRNQLFEPFVSARQGGIGLGLVAARDIVRAHNGTLRLLDQASGGAVFEIELPWQES
jgi:signal transduction histidine kinase